MELIDKERNDIDKRLDALDYLITKALDELYSKDSYLLENEDINGMLLKVDRGWNI